jgi:GT2 family glycosyltransferase/glycosyltransferase involved in cell wall biosynthesis
MTAGDLIKPDSSLEQWFDRVAERICFDLHPESVMDFGTKTGYLVQALRRRGVRAFALLSSEMDQDGLSEEEKSYLSTGSLVQPLPARFDLIVCLEALSGPFTTQADSIVENIARHSDQVLFSALPFFHSDYSVQEVYSLETWAELFARHGFIHDVEYDASYLTPWAAVFRKTEASLPRIVASYEARLHRLEHEARVRREFGIEQKKDLAYKEQIVRDLRAKVADKEFVIEEILNSRSWRLMQRLQAIRLRLIPLGSRREYALLVIVHGFQILRREGVKAFSQRLAEKASWSLKVGLLRIRPGGRGLRSSIQVTEVPQVPEVVAHTASIEIIVCVHNALEDVRRCLDSVFRHSTPPFSLILVDDGSDRPARDFLAGFARDHQALLLRNETSLGYTRAANQGLRRSSAEIVVLLNSDTIVTAGWLDRLAACLLSDPKIGVAGPLSNTASWQSIPEIESNGDWATNRLPAETSIDDMGALVAEDSARLYPPIPFLNGFCLAIRRELIEQIGYFDEELFGQGYGEENDYGMRARQAGWRLAVTDDVYVYHAQSRSYSNERRKRLSEQAGQKLAQKFGQRIIDQGVQSCLHDKALVGIRARSRVLVERREWIERGRQRFQGKKVLFILPIYEPGGGGNVVVNEARAMRKMGVDARIFNLSGHHRRFQSAYPDLDIPVVYGEPADLPHICKAYDAVIATFNPSVAWAAPAMRQVPHPVFGYYIQDFEPYFYPIGSEGYRQAWDSYRLIDGMKRFAKTGWTCGEIQEQIHVDCSAVGCSYDIELFRPRPAAGPQWPDRPLRVAAMIRPSSVYRAPQETMFTFQQVARKFGGSVEFVLFGVSPDDPNFLSLTRDFPWRLAGVLNQRQVANLMNQVDIFVDFSTYQAMGLTALEAMACGAAVILPCQGGATAFAEHGVNSLVIDTANQDERFNSLVTLLRDHQLRAQIQKNAVLSACQYYPEKPAFSILELLFDATILER